MNTQKITGAEIGMIIGLAIALFGGLAIVAVSNDAKTVSLVIWGIGSAFLIFTTGRTAIVMLKGELRRLQSETPPSSGA